MQKSFVPTGSVSNLKYVPTSVLMAGCVNHGTRGVSKINNREERNIDTASEIQLNSWECVCVCVCACVSRCPTLP